MQEMDDLMLKAVGGGRNFFSVLEGALFGAVVEGFIGFCTAGPAGLAVGIVHGLYDGAAFGVIYEGSHGLVELANPEWGPSPG